MSMFAYIFDSEWQQRADILDGRRRIELQRRHEAHHNRQLREDLGGRITALEDDLGEMALFLRTLHRMLIEKGSIDRAEFLEVAKAIDAQDGKADGKYTGPLDAP